MSNKRKVITIDGLAATGKSSIAQSLAKKLGFVHFSSGLLYRLLGYAVLSEKSSLDNEFQVMDILRQVDFGVMLKPSGACAAVLKGKDVTNELYESGISEASSKVSVHPQVREFLLEKQRSVFPGQDIIAEGRDMGTVVFPTAEVKFFINADLNTRIERRLRQIKQDKPLSSEELKSLKQKMEIEVVERDKRDMERLISPTVPAKDAIIINNSRESLTEVVEKMYHFVSKKGFVAK